jgi:hypothetical protein
VASNVEPEVQGCGSPVCICYKDVGTRCRLPECFGSEARNNWIRDVLEDRHICHGECEVFVRVVDGNVLRGSCGSGEHLDARCGHGFFFELSESRSTTEIIANRAVQIYCCTEEMGGFGDVVGDAAEGLADDCWV